MITIAKSVKKNKVLNRFLPIPESVLKGLENEPKITDFTLLKELGVGSFGRVLLVQHKITQAQYAIKAIDKRNKDNIEESPYFRREIEIMYRIHHPNVVKLFGHFEDNTYCYFIMEYIPGGNIYSLCPKNGIPLISTQMVASLIKDVISAIYYLHHMNPPIIHRDIKPENVLLGEGNVAKLTDFGWSNYMQGYSKRTTVCGTPIYLAPEIINNTGHDEKIDIWCIGVLMFELMTGQPPWKGDDITTLKYNIRRLKINWPKNMDPDARDLITKILRYIPEERISLRGMLMHPFFTKYFPDGVNSLKRPDNTQYKVFVISKDHPLTWNPIYGGSNKIEYKPKPSISNSIITTNNNKIEYKPKPSISNSIITTNINQYNYNNSLKFPSLTKGRYNTLRTGSFSTMIPAMSLRTKEFLENEERIHQLVRGTEIKPSTTWYKDSYKESNFKNSFDFNNSYRESDFKNSYRVSEFNNNYRESDFKNSYRGSDFSNSYRESDFKNSYRGSGPYQSLYLSNANNIRDGSLFQSAYRTQSPAYYITTDLNNMNNSITNGNKIIYSQSIVPTINRNINMNNNSITQSNANIILSMKEQDGLRSITPTATLVNAFNQSLPIAKTIK